MSTAHYRKPSNSCDRPCFSPFYEVTEFASPCLEQDMTPSNSIRAGFLNTLGAIDVQCRFVFEPLFGGATVATPLISAILGQEGEIDCVNLASAITSLSLDLNAFASFLEVRVTRPSASQADIETCLSSLPIARTPYPVSCAPRGPCDRVCCAIDVQPSRSLYAFTLRFS